MVSVIGESPVNTLSGTSVPVTVTQAVHALEETSKAIQSEGWHYNTEYDYPLVPDSVTSKITLPVNTLKVDLDPEIIHGLLILYNEVLLYTTGKTTGILGPRT